MEDNFTWANVKASCLTSFPSFLIKISHPHHHPALERMMAAMKSSTTPKHHSETFTTGLLHTVIPLHTAIFPQVGTMLLSLFPFCQARSLLPLFPLPLITFSHSLQNPMHPPKINSTAISSIALLLIIQMI